MIKKLPVIFVILASLALSTSLLLADKLPKADKDGWIPLFNGKDLTGWDGNPEVWRVKDGIISGSIDRLNGGNTFLVFQHEFTDFILEAEFYLVDGRGNSGIQYRSKQSERGDNKWVVKGYQADMAGGWWGKLYEEGGRGGLATKYKEVRDASPVWDDWEFARYEGMQIREGQARRKAEGWDDY